MEGPLMVTDGTDVAGAAIDRAALTQPPHALLTWGALVLPVLKRALCPVCLGVFGSVFAGARLGFLANERLHGAVVAAAVVADVCIRAPTASRSQR
jgi:hypothetical protein